MVDIKFISGNFALLRKFRDAHPDNRLIIMTEDDLVTLGVEDRPLRELNPKEDRLYDFAYDKNNKLLGALTYYFTEKTIIGDSNHALRLCQVSTRDGYTQQGISSTLINRAFQRAQENGCNLSITSFTSLGKQHIAKVCARLHQKYPDLNIYYDNLNSLNGSKAISGEKPYCLNFDAPKATIDYV